MLSLGRTLRASLPVQRFVARKSMTSIETYGSKLKMAGPGRGSMVDSVLFAFVPKRMLTSGQKAGVMALNAGQLSVAAGSLTGLAALCFYGLGLSKQAGIVDEAVLWPRYVSQRISDVYFYFLTSVTSTAVSAYLVSQSPELMMLVTTNGVMGFLITFGLIIGTSVMCHAVTYEPGFGAKQVCLLMHTAVLGAFIAPLCLLGGSIVLRAAAYTGGLCAGLSTVAVCAPSDRFLNWGGPLACGLGVVFLSSIASAFIPPTSGAGMAFYSICLYGGLVLFSMFLLHDTQRVVHNAKMVPRKAYYDPVNESMSIYMDTLNIFIRIATMLAQNQQNQGRGGRRRR